jgi:hypothetical protein
MEKSHCDFAGVHCANRMMMQPNRLSRQRLVMVQRKMRWIREVFMMRVRRATTANLGRAKDKIPGRKPTIVHRMAPDFCSRERVEKWRPLPEETAAHAKPTASQPQIWFAGVRQARLRVLLCSSAGAIEGETYDCCDDEVVI